MGEAAEPTGYGNIKIESPYRIEILTDLEIIRTVNRHTRLHFTGIVPEDKKDTYVEKATAQDKITVSEVSKDGSSKVLFKGVVSSIRIKCVREIYYLDVEALSNTYEMDIKKKSRSFQNEKMTYEELFNEVLKDYPKSDIIDNALKDSKTGKFIIQYEETDWQFLKRIVSEFGKVLIPEEAADAPKFWVGLPKGKDGGELDSHHYVVKKDIENYFETVFNGYTDSNEDNDFICYGLSGAKYLKIGQKVKYKDRPLFVSYSKAVMKNGILEYWYILSFENGIRQNRIENMQIIGASVEGKIIDVSKDTVKIHLDIDREQPKDKATWFPYSSFYTAEGNSGWYCMPQLNDRVKLHFPTAREENGFAMTSVRKDGGGKTEDPSVKYFGTNAGKLMMFSGNEVKFTAKDTKEGKKIFISLQEEKGIEVHSDKPIIISAEKDITIDAKTNIGITAKESIFMLCGSSSITLEQNADISGPKVFMDGSVKAPVPAPQPDEEEEEAPEEQQNDQQNDALKEMAIDTALDVAGMIPVVGIVFNVASMARSAAKGDWLGVGLSLVSCIPFAGAAAKAAKIGKGALKLAKAAKIAKGISKVAKVAKGAKAAKALKAGKMVLGKAVTLAKRLKGKTKTALEAVKKFKDEVRAAICKRIPAVGCFTAGTLIKTSEGYKKIEDIKVWDKVYSENLRTGEKGFKHVKQTFVAEEYTLMRISVKDTEISSTLSHRFYVMDKGWVEAEELNVGDVLKLESGETTEVKALRFEKLEEPVKVYNFEVQDWHVYYVSEYGVLVHNTYKGKMASESPKVEAKLTLNGKEYKDVNPTARNPRLEKGEPIEGLSAINNNTKDAHAEIGAMNQALQEGNKGGKGVLEVKGQPVCKYCKSDVKKMAKKLELDELHVTDETGTYKFTGPEDFKNVSDGGKRWGDALQ